MTPFDDPKLKTAIQSLRGNHQASDELRQKIARRMADEAISPPKSESFARRPYRWFRPVAAAALLMLVAGVALYAYRENRAIENQYAHNDPLFDAMIRVQQEGAAAIPNQTALAAPLTTPGAIADEAAQALARPVPTVRLADGWILDAASLCNVGKFQALRLHFTRGTQQLAFISLPAAAWDGGRDGATYKLTSDGHPIAGYIKAGSLNCFVGDTTVPLDEVVKFRDQIRGS